MAFTHNELTHFAVAPSTSKAENAYEQIKAALHQDSRLRNVHFDIYIQGSYANRTNIKDDSDIDIVVQLATTWKPDLTQLSVLEQAIYHASFPTAQYTWSHFRDDVLAALKNAFGEQNVVNGKKCIKIKGNTNRLNSDVIPVITFRKYRSFSAYNTADFIEGITFWNTDTWQQMTNFPKIHKDNGSDKNAAHRTDQRYKDFVRILKNLRGLFVDSGMLDVQEAQSYFIECLVYNVPDGLFVADYPSTFASIIDYVLRHQDISSFTTVSHQHKLFGTEEWHWQLEKARQFIQLVQALDRMHNGS